MTLHLRRLFGDEPAPGNDIVLEPAFELDAVVAGLREAGGERLDFVQRAMARPRADANSWLYLAAQQID